jgi:YD repeat-containing protein
MSGLHRKKLNCLECHGLLSDGTATYEYDAANRLIQTTREGVVTTYGYDGWGNLIQESANGATTEFVLDENTAYPRILGEVRSDGGERLYAYGPEGFSAQLAVGGGV